MNTLAAWLDAQNITQLEFAKRIGCHQSIVSRLRRREMKPSLDLAVAIERETEGAIPASSWVDHGPITAVEQQAGATQ